MIRPALPTRLLTGACALALIAAAAAAQTRVQPGPAAAGQQGATPRAQEGERERPGSLALSPAAGAVAPAGDEVPGAMIGFTAAHADDERALEQRFDRAIDPAEMDAWLQRLSSAPNQVGGPHDKANAQWQLAMFKGWGWDARIETFEVLYPTPISEKLELLGPKPFTAALHEPAVAGDRTSGLPGQLPPYLAYQGDGDVTAPVVYVNYGMPDDYEALDRMGVSVKGKIVFARYGGGWRGLKPKLAQEHGAVGCVIYSDPADDGYATDDVWPKGPQRPAFGVQRGSVQDMTLYPGDPLTPGVGATAGARRLTRETAKTILRIPAIPVSYADAAPFLAAINGQAVPKAWRGALPFTYHAGTSQAQAHLLVTSDWSLKTIYDVVAVMRGRDLPDQWIVRGNHHDGWVFGAADPLSGQVALMAEAKAIGGLVKAGWRPDRTLVYTSWDAEEPGLLGSTEWAETHGDELQKKAVLYVNSDNNARGFLHGGGSPALQRLFNQAMRDVRDPQTSTSVRERLRARLEVAGFEGSEPRAKRLAKVAAEGGDLPIEALGSGSDYSAFLQHLGVPTLDMDFGGEGEDAGTYHSAYDSYDHMRRFGDPGQAYGAALSKVVGRVVLRASQADAPPLRMSDTAATFALYLDELEKLAIERRERADTLNRLTGDRAFTLAADPTKGFVAPEPVQAVPVTDFGPLETAIARLKTSAARYDALFADAGAALPQARRRELDARLQGLEQTLLDPRGLPDRPWYRNLAYAPGVLTGYGAKTFPGVREALEADHVATAQQYVELTAAAVGRYADAVDGASSLLTARR